MSAIGIAALAVAQSELASGIHGGGAPWGRFRGPRVDDYQRAVGLALPADISLEGHPWCAAGVYWCFGHAAAAATLPGNPCPRTAGALHLWDLSPLTARRQLAAPGDVFVLDKGKGRGHVGFVLAVSPDGQTLTTVEPDTNAAGSTTGDSWGQHLWKPSDGVRGRLVGYLEL